MSHDVETVIIPDWLIDDFKEWLDQRDLCLSGRVKIPGEVDPEGEPCRFVWFK